jgi:hypothetical protein
MLSNILNSGWAIDTYRTFLRNIDGLLDGRLEGKSKQVVDADDFELIAWW